MAGHTVMMGLAILYETSMNFNQLKPRCSAETHDSNIRHGESLKSQIFVCCHVFVRIKIAGNVVDDILCLPQERNV